MSELEREDIEDGGFSLERSHANYLLENDPEIVELERNDTGVAVYFKQLEYSFGDLRMEP